MNIQFSQLLLAILLSSKEIMYRTVISCFLIGITHQIEVFVDIFKYFGPSVVQLQINNVWKPDLVPVVTVHMVYCCACTARKVGLSV